MPFVIFVFPVSCHVMSFAPKGILAERAQNFHQARRYYMKALELSGSNSVITNNLARVEAALQGLAMASPGPY